jgi:hypothetical protein
MRRCYVPVRGADLNNTPVNTSGMNSAVPFDRIQIADPNADADNSMALLSAHRYFRCREELVAA